MESNKLLIGVQFVNPDDSHDSLVFELIVLRDLTLRQLIDGIKYGLEKKGDDPFYSKCRSIFNESISSCDSEGLYKKITLTSYNDALGGKKINGIRAAVMEADIDSDVLRRVTVHMRSIPPP